MIEIVEFIGEVIVGTGKYIIIEVDAQQQKVRLIAVIHAKYVISKIPIVVTSSKTAIRRKKNNKFSIRNPHPPSQRRNLYICYSLNSL